MQSSTVQMLVAARRIADYAKDLGADAERQEIRPSYDHMGALVADSVLQAGLNYKTVVLPRIKAILNLYPDLYRTSAVFELIAVGQTTVFLNWKHPEKVGRFDDLVTFLFEHSIERISDLKEALTDALFVTAMRDVRGVGPKTVDYMGCLVGADSIAVDRHIRTFAKRVGVLEDDYDFLKSVFCCAADLLSLPRREFDAWVWKRESAASIPQMAFAF
ncbi:hypothetical protein BTR14_01570 [Rhizobium rhizosphaerae]|uniref:Uncharacterized protein n=1 Tax=Xaviernesmea rhizosphaerae TaxID=1672749 RepID=A0ABX3PJD4_9HYPH|nr:hypothetical protein [Xaviernesmea rhizosphaerae]OQP88172.1 hypothetical protein BTR14_01570 [Xaviernesmea rhizosphaerae]